MPFLPCSLHKYVEIADAAMPGICERADLFFFHTGLDCFSWQSVRNHLGFLASCDEPRAHLGMNGLIGQNARWVTSKFLLEFFFASIHELKSCFLCSLLGRHLPIAFDNLLLAHRFEAPADGIFIETEKLDLAGSTAGMMPRFVLEKFLNEFGFRLLFDIRIVSQVEIETVVLDRLDDCSLGPSADRHLALFIRLGCTYAH